MKNADAARGGQRGQPLWGVGLGANLKKMREPSQSRKEPGGVPSQGIDPGENVLVCVSSVKLDEHLDERILSVPQPRAP